MDRGFSPMAGLQSVGSQGVGHDRATHIQSYLETNSKQTERWLTVKGPQDRGYHVMAKLK